MKKSIFIALIFLFSISIKAQSGIEAISLASKDDANKLANAYFDPGMKGLLNAMNGGWYHTAKTHNKFGFDISIGLNVSLIPSKDEMFTFSNLNLSSSTTSTSLTGATVAGSNSLEAPISITTTINGQEVSADFKMPGGIKEDLPLNAMPAPSVQFTLGLPSKMDVSIRMVPKIGENDVKGQLLGIGLKKDITSLFGVIEKTPLNVSLFAAYTTMNVDYDLQNDSSINGANQLAEFKLNAYTVQAIASLNFPVINFYGGIGYNGGTSSLNIKGTYKLEYKTNQPPPNDTFEETVTDPISQNFEANGFRTTLGTRLNLGPVKLFGDYTIQEYNTISLGLAVSIR